MNNYWNNKTALITGASGGIGAAIAETLAAQGMRVILVARDTQKLCKVTAQIRSNGGIANYYAFDLTLAENRISLINSIKNDYGIPDVLINNAGIGWYGYFSKMPWGVADNLISLNIETPAHLTSLLLPEMLKLERARIINIGSIAGKLPEQGVALYAASKAFLDTFTKSLFRELRGTTITASVLRAGPVKTNFFENAAEYENGSRIPAEKFAIFPEIVAQKVWSLIKHPRRFAYVPFYLFFSPLLETFFSWAIDLVGPLLLRRSDPSE
ncbi:MAG: SDR family NAD(P)-dependent oxidoreductase [Anaerolineaceae bacterium]